MMEIIERIAIVETEQKHVREDCREIKNTLDEVHMMATETKLKLNGQIPGLARSIDKLSEKVDLLTLKEQATSFKTKLIWSVGAFGLTILIGIIIKMLGL